MRFSHSEKKILIDCSHVFLQPWVHAGVQRVVRNLARELPCVAVSREVLPVALSREQLYHVTDLRPNGLVSSGTVARFASRVRRFNAAMERVLTFDVRFGDPVTKSVLQQVSCFLSFLIRRFDTSPFGPFRRRSVPINAGSGDVFLMLDSSWHDPCFLMQVSNLKARNIKIIAVVYDLIPIKHPEYCTRRLTRIFDAWLNCAAALADGFVCISENVCMELQEEMRKRVKPKTSKTISYGWFHLGSELDQTRGHHDIVGRVSSIFDGQATTFLVVGTIEPRKNHNIILDAFDQHWKAGGESRLCIIGKVGWMCDRVLARLKSHSEIGKKLFWLNSAGDDDLDFAYRNADALVCASFAEGFGLPLVEGLQRGLPVIASDIPVFREVAGDFAEYFDPRNSSHLRAIVDEVSAGKRPLKARPVTDWKRITWTDSARQLIDVVDQCCRKLDEQDSPINAHQH